MEATVGDQDSLKPGTSGQAESLEDIFEVDQGFVVRESQSDIAPCALIECDLDQISGRITLTGDGGTGYHLLIGTLGNTIILAERTGQITAETAGRQDICARAEARQRLFLDRVQGQAGQDTGIVVDNLPTGIAARAAEACLLRSQAAVVMAKGASQAGIRSVRINIGFAVRRGAGFAVGSGINTLLATGFCT